MKWSDIAPYLPWFWGLCLFSLCFSHGVGSASIALLAVVVLLAQFTRNKPKLSLGARDLVLLAFVALFLLQVFALWYFPTNERSVFEVEKKLSLLLIPVLWVLSRFEWKRVNEIFFLCFASGLLLSGLIMVSHSLYNAFLTGDPKWLFYHNLTAPLPISAIYYSWYLVIALFWPLDNLVLLKAKWIATARVVFAGLLLLSASKLFVVLALLLALATVIGRRGAHQIRPKHAFLGALLIGLSYPVVSRFMELRSPHLELVTQDDFTYDSPFNGLNLRLVQWRFGMEILSDQHAWLTGVGPAHKQEMLDAKYEQYGMYTGNPAFGDKGYRQYNFHNQYMETLVANGLPGLFLIVLIIVVLVASKASNHRPAFSSLMIICFAFLLTESTLERRQGVVLFTILVSAAIKPNATHEIQTAYE